MPFASFRKRFRFQPELHLNVGIERECFLTREGVIVPIAPEVLPLINHPAIGYELSACQMESHIGPVALKDVRANLLSMDKLIANAGGRYGFGCTHSEVAPDDMPLDVYPDPAGRYQQIAASMSPEVLRAACQVIGTHIHIGMRDAESALIAYNKAIPHWRELAEIGDGSGGQRLALYRKVALNSEPAQYNSWSGFYASAIARGFADNPRNCWDLIRISGHGTIEFRMFGATGDLEKIASWAEKCYEICSE